MIAGLSSNPWVSRARGLLGPDAGLLKALTAPIFIVMILAMMVLPLPPLASGVWNSRPNRSNWASWRRARASY